MRNKIGIVCCSNGQKNEYKNDIDKLGDVLHNKGFSPVYSEYIYECNSCFSGSARERAKALMDFYCDDDIFAIYDISGGDIANEILPYLDYEIIKASKKMFWGYSDLTTVINAIYSKTGGLNVLYQVKNLVWDKSEEQIKRYNEYIDKKEDNNCELFDFKYSFIQGNYMSGIVVGGNIRCFLKLAGTEYFPDMTGKILLLEALGGEVPQMVTYLNQLKQMGVFEKINGILLGTFITMDKNDCKPNMSELVRTYAGEKIPIAKTEEIGHGTNSKAIIIGGMLELF